MMYIYFIYVSLYKYHSSLFFHRKLTVVEEEIKEFARGDVEGLRCGAKEFRVLTLRTCSCMEYLLVNKIIT